MPTVSITMYSARGGCLVRVKDGVMFNPSIRVEGEHREEVDVSDLDNMLKQYAAFLDRCVESGEYAINPECIKNPLPRPVSQQPATLPENSEQDPPGDQDVLSVVIEQRIGVTEHAFWLLELLQNCLDLSETHAIQHLVFASNWGQLTPSMDWPTKRNRVELYIETFDEAQSKFPGDENREIRFKYVKETCQSWAKSISNGSANDIPRQQPEQPASEDLPDPEAPREYWRDYVGLALFKATSKNGKEYSYWKLYYVDPEDPNAVKAQGRIVTFGDHADTIRWLVPEEERPEDEKMVRLSQPIRGYYTLGKQADGRKFTEWTKFERAD